MKIQWHRQQQRDWINTASQPVDQSSSSPDVYNQVYLTWVYDDIMYVTITINIVFLQVKPLLTHLSCSLANMYIAIVSLFERC